MTIETLGDWIATLETAGFLEMRHAIGTAKQVGLRLPFEIRISRELFRVLRDAYTPTREIGGVLVGVPRLDGAVPNLDVAEVVVVPNVSPTPDREYVPLQPLLRKVVRRALVGRPGGVRAIPLFFHSHPAHRTDLGPEMVFFREYFNLATSEDDRASSLGDWNHGNYRIHLPRVLVSGISSELFVGVYGGGVLPDDFRGCFSEPIQRMHREMMALPVEPQDSLGIKALAFLAKVGTSLALVAAESQPGAREFIGSMMAGLEEAEGGTRTYAISDSEVLIRVLRTATSVPPSGLFLEPDAELSAHPGHFEGERHRAGLHPAVA